MAPPDLRVALCHEWLAERTGSEKTFEAMAEALPSADLYALTRDPTVPFAFGGRQVSTTALDRVAWLRRRRAWQLPLMPLAWRYVTSRGYDLAVTSSHACAKGFRPGRRAVHLCYCYTPMRYVWLPNVDERRRADVLSRAAASALRSWDLKSTTWVDDFAAISTAVQARIDQFYGRKARVIFPPVDTEFFTPGAEPGRVDYAVTVSRMVPYKRLDLVIRACHHLNYPLIVAGWGSDEGRLRSLADDLGADVTFVIAPSDSELRDLYRRATVAVFAADEDFGIAPVEAQACGTPVVALGRGGSLDIVIPDETGVLVHGQDEESFRAGVASALSRSFDPNRCRANAERFSGDRFRSEIRSWVADVAASHGWDTTAMLGG